MSEATGFGDAFPRRTVIWGTLLPAVIYGLGHGAISPLIVARAVQIGADLSQAALLTAAPIVGGILANIPAGHFAARRGDRAALMLGAVLSAGCFALLSGVDHVLWMALALFLLGASSTIFSLARHAHLTRITPAHYRARVMSTLGGVHRISLFTGPLIGAGLVQLFSIQAAFAFGVVSSLVAAAVVALANDRGERVELPSGAQTGWRSIWSSHGAILSRLGVCVAFVSLVRSVRQIALPVWAEYIGIDPVQVSLIFALSSGVDMLLFYPAGFIMDRFGRLWAAIPSMVLLGASVAALAGTDSVGSISVVAIAMGLANGLGSGILMTLGSDTAPADHRRPAYLAIWKIYGDIGVGAAPLLISGTAAVGALAVGLVATGGIGLMAALALYRWVPRYGGISQPRL